MAQLMEMGNNPIKETPKANEYLKKLADEIEKNPPEDTNDGHNKLMTDLVEVVYDAYHYEFYDFKNNKYTTPKVKLVELLKKIQQNIIDGKYDNT